MTTDKPPRSGAAPRPDQAGEPTTRSTNTTTGTSGGNAERNPIGAPTDFVTRYRFGGALDELMNPRCSSCARPHRHLVPAGATERVFERRPHCRPWTRYLLTVTKVVPGPLRRVGLPGPRRRGVA